MFSRFAVRINLAVKRPFQGLLLDKRFKSMSKHGKTKHYAKQHFVAQCYTKPWHDSSSYGENKTPYVWVFDKDGKNPQRRAPVNIFTENDIYTFPAPDGTRDLSLEHGLQELEDKFTRIRNTTFFRGVWPDAEQMSWILAFVSTAHSRTQSFRDFHAQQWRNIRERMEDLSQSMKIASPEQRKSAASISSLERTDKSRGWSIDDVRKFEERTLQYMLPSIMSFELPVMARMAIAVFRTDDPVGFVTTDTPVMYFDPDAYKRQPIYRSPGLGCKSIEITLPLSPKLCLALTHQPEFSGFIDTPHRALNELNRLRIYCADKNFISCKNEIRPEWFQHPSMPEDSWENVRARKLASGEWQ